MMARAAPKNANYQWEWMLTVWINEVKWFYFINP